MKKNYQTHSIYNNHYDPYLTLTKKALKTNEFKIQFILW